MSRGVIGKVSKRPECVKYLQGLVDRGLPHRKIYYPTLEFKGKMGVLVVAVGPRILTPMFTENKDGTINWHPRITGPKGKVFFHYEFGSGLPMAICHQIADAIKDVANEAWGSEGQITAKIDSYKEKEKSDSLQGLLKDVGSI